MPAEYIQGGKASLESLAARFHLNEWVRESAKTIYRRAWAENIDSRTSASALLAASVVEATRFSYEEGPDVGSILEAAGAKVEDFRAADGLVQRLRQRGDVPYRERVRRESDGRKARAKKAARLAKRKAKYAGTGTHSLRSGKTY